MQYSLDENLVSCNWMIVHFSRRCPRQIDCPRVWAQNHGSIRGRSGYICKNTTSRLVLRDTVGYVKVLSGVFVHIFPKNRGNGSNSFPSSSFSFFPPFAPFLLLSFRQKQRKNWKSFFVRRSVFVCIESKNTVPYYSIFGYIIPFRLLCFSQSTIGRLYYIHNLKSCKSVFCFWYIELTEWNRFILVIKRLLMRVPILLREKRCYSEKCHKLRQLYLPFLRKNNVRLTIYVSKRGHF